jgi:hypothetical protein
VAANAQGLARINAEEQQALADNRKRMIEDKDNAAVYAAARAEIVKRFARERALLEEQTTQEIAEANIQTTTDEAMRIEMIRVESVRRAEAAEKNGVMTHAQAERAKSAATFTAEQSRADLTERNARARADAAIVSARSTEQQIQLIRDEAIRQAEAAYRRGQTTFEEAEAAKVRAVQNAIDQQKQLEMQRQQTRVQTLQIRAQTTSDPAAQEAAIRGQGQLQIDALNERAQADLDNWQTYADQKIAITEQMEQQIQDVQAASTLAQIALAQSAAGQMLGVLQRAGKERTAMGKTLFLAERALAVASIILNTEMGAQKAIGMAGMFGIPMATLIRAQGYASAGMVAGLALADTFGGGRQYGGPVSADTMYRVNETGRPEMYTAANGAQYMLPTSGGRVTPADQVGAGSAVQWQIIVNNNAPGATATASVDQQSRTVTIAVNEVASQIAERRGAVWGAMRTTNVQGRPG